MGPGHPSNQSGIAGGQPPGVTMGQQVHPGIAGGGPQVTQPGTMMAGMPQGAPGVIAGGAPNAMALSHLNPGHPQMYPQQQLQARKSLSDVLSLFCRMEI